MSSTDSTPTDNQNCKLVGIVGIIIQLALGALSFSVLIFKRWREKPKRPWRIWILDTSKQIISQLFAHFINLTISIALSYE
jgi:O-antigen/teichoic acid export membrane protein